jgi:hypothetical protein
MASRNSRIAARRAVETRRLYHFEVIALPAISRSACANVPMPELRRFAERVWRAESKRAMPRVVAGNGDRPNPDSVWYSYCTWPKRDLIVLARHQRNRSVVLHELVHALGFGTHGRGFVRKYFDLLAKYARCNRAQLESHAKTLNVKH